MKATGIIRRIDDLGRIIIPKEIRRTLRLREGDSMELYTDGEEVTLKKYSPIFDLKGKAKTYCFELARTIDKICIITDRDNIVSTTFSASPLLEDNLRPTMDKVINDRKSFNCINVENVGIVTIVPIIAEGEVVGTVVVVHKDSSELDASILKLIEYTARIIGRKLED